MSTSIHELIRAGEQLDLSGTDLQAFIKEQQTKEREERELERQAKKEERGIQERQAQAKAEEQKRDIELKKLELEIKKTELEVRVEESSNRSQNTDEDNDDDVVNDEVVVRRGVGSHSTVKGPKMSPFDDRDDMDSYLHRFERYAELQNWRRDVWAVYLAALLKGKALDVYARLTPEQSKDYDVLKKALLKRYALTEEGYKAKFYDSKPEPGESPQQFITRLESYFMRWLDLAKVETSYEGVKALMVKERYLATCTKQLELFLRERALTGLEELGKLAEQYEDAHGAKAVVRQDKFQPTVSESPRRQRFNRGIARKSTSSELGKPKCFNCGRLGHIARNCFRREKVGAMTSYSGEPNVIPEFEHTEIAQGMTFRNQLPRHNQRLEMSRPDQNVQPRFAQPNGRPFQSERNFMQNSEGQQVQRQKQPTCKAHGRLLCPECLNLNSAGVHSCGASLEPEAMLSCGCIVPFLAEACSLSRRPDSKMPVAEGKLFDKTVKVLRDTGCSTVVVRRSLVPDSCLTGETVVCGLIDGTLRQNPVARITVNTPYLKGTVKATCMINPLYDLIVGNIPEAEDLNWSCRTECESCDSADMSAVLQSGSNREVVEDTLAVVTRAQAKSERKVKLLKVIDSIDTEITTDELIRLQRADESLRGWWQKAERKDDNTDLETQYEVKNQLLWRVREDQKRTVRQLAVPQPLREKVMKLAHDCIMSGHQGVKKTYDRVASQFFWPGIHGDVQRYCRSCDICQRTSPKGRVSKVPLGHMPLMDMPFKRVAVDLIGPIAPVTDRGNRYVLTMVDYATRYPEATALKSVEAETVAEALVTMFTRVGIPEEVLSDQGSQFMSGVMKEVCRLLSVSQLHTTVYHPMCNGLVERFNGTLKAMLKKMCAEKPKDWDRYLPALLFAYREVPQESLGFSAFELLYGRSVRGPMSILKEVWTKQAADPEVKLTYQYVLELQDRLQETCEMARQELSRAQCKQKKYYDVKSKDRVFQPGDKVLLLLPTDENKLLMHWKGPFEVIERRNDNNYRIQLNDRVKMFHANMLKKYNVRQKEQEAEVHEFGAVVIEEQDVEVTPSPFTEFSSEQKETYRDVNINPELPEQKKQEIQQLLVEFADIFTDVPKVTNLGEHAIHVTTSEPVRTRPYSLPFAVREEVNQEIDSMLRHQIIEPSSAPYMSPIVVVKKSDGSNRICVDYRKLNKVTVFDPEPMPQMQEIFSGLSGSQYFSKFDFCKGYWQVSMRPHDRDLTTFVGPEGLYRFRVMPFGLVNAPATFSRIMRKLLRGLRNLRNYLDDVLGHTGSWAEHPNILREFFTRVRAANLALKPSKCFVGYTSLVFLGHKLGPGSLSPNEDLVAKIRQAPSPANKKQLRSFLGLVGYYRSFVPNFAAIAAPLTDLTKRGSPEKLLWTDVQEQAFQTLKSHVCAKPVLCLPDINKPFILQTDASADGIGSILLQEVDSVKRPVGFASKKLLPRERNYSTIEREALAIVWGIQKFQNYLMGTHFILETDHHPLQYLDKAKYQNSRIMRWSLLIQPYRFTVRAIKGSENVGADFLSRCVYESV